MTEHLDRSMEAGELIKRLSAEDATRTGVQIAQVILEQGISVWDAQTAFIALRYIATVEPVFSDLDALHVSDHPMEAGLAVIIAMQAPQALPEIVWEKKSQSNE